MSDHLNAEPLYGLMAEFETPEEIIAAAKKFHGAGYTKIDAYTPFPIEEVSEAIGVHGTRLPLLVFACGAIGGVAGFLMQWFASVIHYPINIGGRPFNSWVSFIPPSYECTILLASFGAVFGMLGFNGLPMHYHPVFNVPRFKEASRHRFFFVVETIDPLFDAVKTKKLMTDLKATGVYDIEP